MENSKHSTQHEDNQAVKNLRARLTKGQNIDFTRKINKLGLDGGIKWAEALVVRMGDLGYTK